LPRQYQSPPDEPIGLLVAATRRRIKQAVGLRLRSHRLSPQQFWVLTVISEHEGRSLRELAGWQRLDEPTASRVVGNLTRQGLVRVDVDRGDRRRRSLVLTPKGRALARRLRPIALAVRAAIVAGLSTAEVRVLRAGLRKVIANMERFAQGSRGGAARVASGTRVALLAALLVAPGAACGRDAPPPASASVPVVVAALTGLARRSGRAYDALVGELSEAVSTLSQVAANSRAVVHSIDVNPLAYTESGQMAAIDVRVQLRPVAAE